MKKIFILLILPLLMAAATSCESELDRLWENPNKYTPSPDAICSGLFTHMQKTRFWQMDYGEWYWMFGNGGIPVMIQVIGGMEPALTGENFTEIYEGALLGNYATPGYPDATRCPGYSTNGNERNRFNYFYTDLSNYSIIRDEVANLEGTGKDDNQIYFELATVLKNVVALQTVDLFNKIPYSNAFRGNDGVFTVPYDDPKQIYESALDEYARIAKELPGVASKMSASAKSTFSKQDLFFGGDVDKWVRYINAQILRSAVRAADGGITPSKYLTADVLNNLPTEDYLFKSRQKCPQTWGRGDGGGEMFFRGLSDRFWRITVPDNIMERMKVDQTSRVYNYNVDDPRLPVIAMGFVRSDDATSPAPEYYGVSGNWNRNLAVMMGTHPTEQGPTHGATQGRRINIYPQVDTVGTFIDDINDQSEGGPAEYVQGTPWTFYNPMTYICADDYHFKIESHAEVELFLAEVALKGLAPVGGDAKSHLENAINASVDFWYTMNGFADGTLAAKNTPYTDLARKILQPAKPVTSGTYASTVAGKLTGSVEDDMEIIMQQKYIHLNLIGVYELFAEIRRTRHPKIEPITLTWDKTGVSLANAKMTIERVRYPDSERTNNAAEYAKVEGEDNWTTPVFWSTKRDSYFLNQALKTD
ncbi:MAG: SusD/RagB family nutrient-binding outer membrane lipoprotein [Prevotellaceae bacterium]|jgi:hypothetical protein|nr:SusD/RagB family nutrient-binding outer membrane lipoprotein [Prevotellaceae bacterium]